MELDFTAELIMTTHLARDLMIFTILAEGPLVFLEACMVVFMQIYKSQFGRKRKVYDL